MDGDGVSLVDHALDERLVLLSIVEDEERRFRAVLLECVENARRDALAGAIVERQVDAAGLVGLLDRDGALGGRGVARLVGHGIGDRVVTRGRGVDGTAHGDGGGDVAVDVVRRGHALVLPVGAEIGEAVRVATQLDDRGGRVADGHGARGVCSAAAVGEGVCNRVVAGAAGVEVTLLLHVAAQVGAAAVGACAGVGVVRTGGNLLVLFTVERQHRLGAEDKIACDQAPYADNQRGQYRRSHGQRPDPRMPTAVVMMFLRRGGSRLHAFSTHA